MYIYMYAYMQGADGAIDSEVIRYLKATANVLAEKAPEEEGDGMLAYIYIYIYI